MAIRLFPDLTVIGVVLFAAIGYVTNASQDYLAGTDPQTEAPGSEAACGACETTIIPLPPAPVVPSEPQGRDDGSDEEDHEDDEDDDRKRDEKRERKGRR